MYSAWLLQITAVVTMYATNSGLGPDINLYGKKQKGDNVTVFQLICTTSRKTLGCSVEFHVNDKTEDDIRFFDDKCVHKNGQCSSDVCDCSNDCKTFRLNITITTGNSITNFGCGTGISIMDIDTLTDITYSMRTAVQQDGEDFRIWEKYIIAVNVEKHRDIDQLEPESTSIFTVMYVVIGVVTLVVTIATAISSPLKKYIIPDCLLQRDQRRQLRNDDRVSTPRSSTTDNGCELTAQGHVHAGLHRHISVDSSTSSSSIERSTSSQD